MSFQFGTFLIAPNLRAGVNSPAGKSCATISEFAYSKRMPALSVRRFNFQLSCAYTPRFAFISSRWKNGLAYITTVVGTAVEGVVPRNRYDRLPLTNVESSVTP